MAMAEFILEMRNPSQMGKLCLCCSYFLFYVLFFKLGYFCSDQGHVSLDLE